jgi:hypothetical protein
MREVQTTELEHNENNARTLKVSRKYLGTGKDWELEQGKPG